jgi:hypothetical protein
MYLILINNMKKYIFTGIFFAAICTAWALLLNPFASWDDLTEKTPDIIVGRCIATEDMMAPKPTIIFGNVVNSDIEVISVLKGDTKPGLSHLASLYRPYRGEYFLAFAEHFTYQTNSGYEANEEYRVIPISPYFRRNELNGKPLKEQIQLVLQVRLEDLNKELAHDTEEKMRVVAGLNITKGASINKLYMMTHLWPHWTPYDCGNLAFVSNSRCKCYLLTRPNTSVSASSNLPPMLPPSTSSKGGITF